MIKKSLFVYWLFIKVGIFGLLIILISVTQIFSADATQSFWYDSNMSYANLQKAAQNNKDIDKLNYQGYSALMLASAQGKTDFVKLLLNSGADINLVASDAAGSSPLHFACNTVKADTITTLIKNYANPIVKNKQGERPIMLIVRAGNATDFRNAFEAFVQDGVDINITDSVGKSILFWVADSRRFELIELLQKYYSHLIDFDLKDKDGKNIITYASQLQLGDIVNYIKPKYMPPLSGSVDVNSYDERNSLSRNFTPVITAAVKGNADYIKKAIKEYGANLNLKDKLFGGSCLHWACLYNRPKCIEVIARDGTDMNLKNKTGLAPIHCLWGIRENADRQKVAKLLFDFGANFNIQDDSGNTFLHRAVLWKDTDYVKLIASDEYFYQRVTFGLKNKAGKTAIDIARQYKYQEIIDLLKNYEDINYLSEKDKQKKNTALMLACMRGDEPAAKSIISSSKQAINEKTVDNDTPLHFAIRFRNIDIAKMLLKGGAKVNEKNNLGHTPMHEIASIYDKAKREEAAKLLFDSGAGIYEDKNGETVIHLAVRKKMPELISFLKQNIGKVEKNSQGKTAYDIANEMSKQEDMKAVINALDGITTNKK